MDPRLILAVPLTITFLVRIKVYYGQHIVVYFQDNWMKNILFQPQNHTSVFFSIIVCIECFFFKSTKRAFPALGLAQILSFILEPISHQNPHLIVLHIVPLKLCCFSCVILLKHLEVTIIVRSVSSAHFQSALLLRKEQHCHGFSSVLFQYN